MTSQEEAILDMLDALEVRRNLEVAQEAMIQSQIAAGNAVVRDHEPVFRAWLTRYVGYETLLPELVAIYLEVTSEEDARALAAFYRTPVGKRALHRLPEGMAKLAALGTARALAHQGDFARMVNEAKERS